MSQEFKRNDITITRYWDNCAKFVLHRDTYDVDELKTLIAFLRWLYRREKRKHKKTVDNKP